MSKSRILVVTMLCLIVAALVISVFCGAEPPADLVLRVTPTGQTDVVVEYGQTYEESGARGFLCAGDTQTEIPVDTEGEVDAQTLGTYTVRYSARYRGRQGTAYRRVRVVDREAPVITLNGDPDRYLLPTENYEEEGFSATDNYDGDLTERVEKNVTRDAIVYTVTDSSGNTASVTRNIRYDDPIAPELQLKGEASIVLAAGDGYREPGYTATDNCDGDITSRVTVSGSVNVFVPGRYTLTYTVKDSFENTTSVTRSVFIKDWDTEQVNDPSNREKVIYLTFDDGPGPDTPRLLDILARYNVQATFFVVDTKYISTVERAAREGHTIGIHTATHVFKEIYASEDAYFADLERIRNAVETHTGQTPVLMRFPGGSSNTVSSFNKGIMTRLTAAVEEKGYTYFDWNVDSRDAGGARTPDEVLGYVIEGVGNKTNSVVLMHDIKSYTVDAVEWIIRWGLQNGYTFLPLTPDAPTCHHVVRN